MAARELRIEKLTQVYFLHIFYSLYGAAVITRTLSS